MVCVTCGSSVCRNFVSESIVGTSVGQADFFSDIMEWWNSLSNTYKYLIIGGSIAVVGLIFAIALLPKKRIEAVVPSPTTKGLEELLKLKLIKELAE